MGLRGRRETDSRYNLHLRPPWPRESKGAFFIPPASIQPESLVKMIEQVQGLPDVRIALRRSRYRRAMRTGVTGLCSTRSKAFLIGARGSLGSQIHPPLNSSVKTDGRARWSRKSTTSCFLASPEDDSMMCIPQSFCENDIVRCI